MVNTFHDKLTKEKCSKLLRMCLHAIGEKILKLSSVFFFLEIFDLRHIETNDKLIYILK